MSFQLRLNETESDSQKQRVMRPFSFSVDYEGQPWGKLEYLKNIRDSIKKIRWGIPEEL